MNMTRLSSWPSFVPAIHGEQGADARRKAGHDEPYCERAPRSDFPSVLFGVH
jgi:hypothetical protein